MKAPLALALCLSATLFACTETPAHPAGDGGSDALPTDGGALTDTAPPVDPTPVLPSQGQLLIEELYYAGSPPAGGTDHYFSDQFIELVNSSERHLDLSGLLIGEVEGSAGAINPGMTPDSYRDSHPDAVVMSAIWRVPAGTVLQPGGRLVIAHDGSNHRPFSTVDLSAANLEAYVEGSARDEDSPTVDNLEQVLFNGGYDWLLTVFGPSVVILAADAPLTEVAADFYDLRSAPLAFVLDGIETLMDADSAAFKRLPDAIDRGFAWVSDTYTGESLRRRRDGEGWQDTNDSAADFELATPDPGLVPAPEAAVGEPWITLGAGPAAFTPLNPGDNIELVAGAQGGWHLDVAARFGGFSPEGLTLSYDAVDESGATVSFTTDATLRRSAVIGDGETWERVGDRVVLDLRSRAEIVGRSFILRVRATQGESTSSDEQTVTVVDEAR